jgi:Cys-rich repeat protein
MTQLCIKNADCPTGETCNVTGGSYKLHYTITKR